MIKITYHKNGHRHEAVSKAKRMLVKIGKQFGDNQGIFYCNIQLAGINNIDRKEVLSYAENHLRKLSNQIKRVLLQNSIFIEGKVNEDYEEGLYISSLKERMLLIEALENVHQFIWDNYPEIDIKKTDTVVLKETTTEAKKLKLVDHFRSNPVVGFNQEYFAVFENKPPRQLFPMTFSAFDLEDAIGVYVEYQ